MIAFFSYKTYKKYKSEKERRGRRGRSSISVEKPRMLDKKVLYNRLIAKSQHIYQINSLPVDGLIKISDVDTNKTIEKCFKYADFVLSSPISYRRLSNRLSEFGGIIEDNYWRRAR